MWIADLKLVLSFCICTALAYHGSKQDYIKWRERFLTNRPPTPTTTTQSSVVTSENDIYYENLKLRHHSRFPNLDRVMLKIDNMQQTGHRKSEILPLQHNKVRHQNIYRTITTTTTTDEGLFGDDYEEEYEDDNNTNDLNEYDDWEDENNDSNNDNFDDYDDESVDDDDPFSDDDAEWQAEEATEPQITAPVSSLTKYKWDRYGTRSRVEESRRQQLHLRPLTELRATNAVVEHYMKVKQEGLCRKPLPKVIPVQSEHPDPTKTYTPHCTILHRCAEDTGCCSSYETRCGPKIQVPVHLYFYTKTLGVAETKVEKLTFYNHTECACIEKSKQQQTQILTTTENNVLALKSSPLHSESLIHCRCSEEFTPKYRYDTGCSCDCEDYNHDCIKMKKGEEHFSLTDRKCIMNNQCGIPVCEYGIYLRQIGRCQRKQEKLNSYRKVTIQ